MRHSRAERWHDAGGNDMGDDGVGNEEAVAVLGRPMDVDQSDRRTLRRRSCVLIRQRPRDLIFFASCTILPCIIPTGVLPSHCPTVPHSPPSISPTFLASSTREIPPTDRSSRECHALRLHLRRSMICAAPTRPRMSHLSCPLTSLRGGGFRHPP